MLAIIILGSIGIAGAEEACGPRPNEFRCVEYVRNYDADTITVNIPGLPDIFGRNIGVRVRHIDTPEIKGKLPCEKQAARSAQNLVENLLKRAKQIDLKNLGRDKYFRVLADVLVDGKDLKELLIKNQLAYAYEGGKKKQLNWCERLPAGTNPSK